MQNKHTQNSHVLNSHVLFNVSNGVAELTLNRPDVHNAFDDNIIEALISHLEIAAELPGLRVLILRSAGKNFSAGADLAWMRRMADNSHNDNLKDAYRLARLMQLLNDFNCPTIALIQGVAYGGAVGLAACCDIVIASEVSKFCLSEVRIGLIPAVISPYVIRAIGERQARRYFISAEPFSAQQAMIFGLVHEVVAEDQLQHSADDMVNKLLQNSPQGMHAAKQLIQTVSQQPIDDILIAETANRIAYIRISSEGQEGLSAFLEKRPPAWVKN